MSDKTATQGDYIPGQWRSGSSSDSPSDKDLADALVRLGILFRDSGSWRLETDRGWMVWITKPLSDWRVAGACLERMRFTVIAAHMVDINDDGTLNPRAIIEAYVRADDR